MICSKNSVKLIAKNCCSAHCAPRKTSYIELKISSGNKINNISLDAEVVNILFMRFGNSKIIADTTKHIAPVKIKPELTIDPIAFLSFFPA